MGVQAELLKTAGGVATAVKALSGDAEKELKEAEKEAGALAIRHNAPKSAPEEPKKPENVKAESSMKQQEVETMSQKAKDSLMAAQIQKQKRKAADHMNLVNQLRRMREAELKKKAGDK